MFFALSVDSPFIGRMPPATINRSTIAFLIFLVLRVCASAGINASAQFTVAQDWGAGANATLRILITAILQLLHGPLNLIFPATLLHTITSSSRITTGNILYSSQKPTIKILFLPEVRFSSICRSILATLAARNQRI